MNFETAANLFRNDKIGTLAESPDGLRFLKLRSISRKEYLDQLFEEAGVRSRNNKQAGMLRDAFVRRSEISNDVIERTIRFLYHKEHVTRQTQETDLFNELYKLKSFDWGGLHQNSLEKTIVDNYVKKITDYDRLNKLIDNELVGRMRGYVLCSWYNHWTTILIEDLFFRHDRVLPAVGKIKKVDFFVNNVPFDLKVTYLPEGFIEECRKNEQLKPELTLLKRAARTVEVTFDRALPKNRLLEDLWAKLKDHPADICQFTISELHNYRIGKLAECHVDASGLIRWLYQNQGVRRFDASNRLFLVLVDPGNFFDSWKLKRAKPLLEKEIKRYLDMIARKPGMDIEFSWDGTQYQVTADVLFVVAPWEYNRVPDSKSG